MANTKQRVLVVESDAVTLARWLTTLGASGLDGVGEPSWRCARKHFAASSWRERSFEYVICELDACADRALEQLDQLACLTPAPALGVSCAHIDCALASILNRRRIAYLLKPVQRARLLELVAEMRASRRAPGLALGQRSVGTYSEAYGLSERERQVLDCCIAGYGREETAAALSIAVGTVHRLWGRILARTGNATQDAVLRQVIRHVAGMPAVPRAALAS